MEIFGMNGIKIENKENITSIEIILFSKPKNVCNTNKFIILHTQ